MPGTTGYPNPSIKLISGTVNGENNPALGSPIASSGLAGGLISSYGGFLGIRMRFGADDALKMSNTTVGTLMGGEYQMVRIAPAAAVGSLTRGRIVFWDTSAAEGAYQVTNDETQNGGSPLFAGVLVNAPTVGNYCFVQVSGRATLQLRATVTAATRNLGFAGAGAGADNATFDSIAAATAVTGANLYPTMLAIAEAVATNGALVIADMLPGKWTVRP
jgi:hypothetical protein